jgi:hypothetical protein
MSDVIFQGVSIELVYLVREDGREETAVRVPFETEKLARRHAPVITALLKDRELFCDLVARHLDRRVEPQAIDAVAIVRDATALGRSVVQAFYHDEVPF